MDGWTKCAISACSFAVSSFGKLQHGLARALEELRRDAPRVHQILGQPGPRLGRHGLHADLRATAAVLRPLLHPLGADHERRIVHVPDRQRKRAEPLEEVVVEHLLAVDVDGLAQFSELGQRPDVVEDRVFRVHRARRPDVREQRGLPVAVVRLPDTVADPESRRHPTAAGRERTVTHQAAADDLPLEVRQPVGHRLHHPVADAEVLGLAPSSRRPDAVIGRAPELRPPVPRRLRDGELEELVRAAVVEPAHDLLRGTTAPASGSYESTSTGSFWLTIFPIFS